MLPSKVFSLNTIPKDLGETECLEEENIEPFLSIISDHTAKCTGTDPYTIVRIWSYDDANNNGDDTVSPNDNASILECCHSRDAEGPTVICTPSMFFLCKPMRCPCINVK